MKVNSKTLAAQLAKTLDANDKNGRDGKIESSVWNTFVTDKGGKTISNYINYNDAVKSLIVYLCRQAKEKGRLIAELGQEWVNNLNKEQMAAENSETTSKNTNNNDRTEQTKDNQKVEKDKNNVKKAPKVKKNIKTDKSKKVDTSYSKISRDKALAKAKNDSRLERLTGGSGWSISEESFITDIPYARKFTGKILSFVASIIGENLVVTSALGTGGTKKQKTPHKVSQGYCTHHNAENPKLDIRTNGNSRRLQKKLKATGLFSRVAVEPDHLDVQIKNEVYLAFELGHKLKKILAFAKINKIMELLS